MPQISIRLPLMNKEKVSVYNMLVGNIEENSKENNGYVYKILKNALESEQNDSETDRCACQCEKHAPSEGQNMSEIFNEIVSKNIKTVTIANKLEIEIIWE